MFTMKTPSGFLVDLHMPKALDSSKGTHSLPPFALRQTYVVDEYEESLNHWMRSSNKATSYFVGIKKDHGLWLDFNKNNSNTHDVAVLVSIQGVNVVTGKQASTKLEKYDDKCPVHDMPFGYERLCEACNFKWPAQNYIANTGTPAMLFWLDGFRAADGTVRQFVFTEEQVRSIAAQVVGSDRTFSIGLAFYKSKKPKPPPPQLPTPHWGPVGSGSVVVTPLVYHSKPAYTHNTNPVWVGPIEELTSGKLSYDSSMPMCSDATLNVEQASAQLNNVVTCGSFYVHNATDARALTMDCSHERLDVDRSNDVEEIAATYEIAAGAKINQTIYADPMKLDHWEDEPSGVIYINYCDDRIVEQIVSKNKKELGSSDGFMQNLIIGHDPFNIVTSL